MRRKKLTLWRYKRQFLRKQKKYLRRIGRKTKRLKKRENTKIHKAYKVFNLMEFLDSKGFGKKSKSLRKTRTINVPEVFSFINNPDGAIDLLRQLFYHGTDKSVRKFYFNHSECKNLGICASTVMDVILMEIKRQHVNSRRTFRLSGEMPSQGEIRDILEVSGLHKHMGIQTPERSHIKKLELIKGSKYKPQMSSGDVATQVTNYFIECLKTQQLGLDGNGRQKISEMVGEVIDNCNLHGGDLSEWFTLGHYNLVDGTRYGQCHLVIFHWGMTIFESLKTATNKKTTRSLNKLTRKHRRFFGGDWTEESLWTLYALQDGVSRLRNDKEPDRGTGTVRLIESFQSIGGTSTGDLPEMSITSGHTHIYFNSKYKMKEKQFGEEIRQVIAFNPTNDLNKPPDPENIKILKNFFPGTVISMKFFLDRTFITKLMEDGRNGNRS